MVHALEIINSTISVAMVIVVIPTLLAGMMYDMYWSCKRHDRMLSVFDAYVEMVESHVVPVEIVVKCGNEISELTNGIKNKLVAIKALSTLGYIKSQTEYYQLKAKKEIQHI